MPNSELSKARRRGGGFLPGLISWTGAYRQPGAEEADQRHFLRVSDGRHRSRGIEYRNDGLAATVSDDGEPFDPAGSRRRTSTRWKTARSAIGNPPAALADEMVEYRRVTTAII